jgi:hypothetical protein
VQLVVVLQLTAVAMFAPNLTVVGVNKLQMPAQKPPPVIVTTVPPPAGPLLGLTEVTVGGGGGGAV